MMLRGSAMEFMLRETHRIQEEALQAWVSTHFLQRVTKY